MSDDKKPIDNTTDASVVVDAPTISTFDPACLLECMARLEENQNKLMISTSDRGSSINHLGESIAQIICTLGESNNAPASAMIARLGESVDQLEASLNKNSPQPDAPIQLGYCVLNPYFNPKK